MGVDFTNLKNFMDDMADQHTPGNAVEVYLNGRSVFRYSRGYADLKGKVPMREMSCFISIPVPRWLRLLQECSCWSRGRSF